MDITDVNIFGRKVFFIVPDEALISKDDLEGLCAMGYEAYSIKDDNLCSIKKKVEVIANVFPNSIIYFNIEASVAGVEWKSYIKDLRMTKKDDILIGILFHNSSKKEEITNYYGRDLGVQAGCVELKSDAIDNLEVIRKVLKETGAKGRRDNIRIDCDNDSSLDFSFGGSSYTPKIEDISLTHFRCIMDNDIGARIFEKFRNVRIKFAGMQLLCDAVLIMKRTKGNVTTYISMFIHKRPEDLPELAKEEREILNKTIYSALTQKRMNFLKEQFSK